MTAATPILDDVDRRLLATLQLNGRASWSQVARVVGASESTVQRRFAALRSRGATRVIGVVDVLKCGLGVPVLVRFSCRRGAVHELAARLTSRPEARFVAVMAGSADAVAEFVLPSHQSLPQLLLHDLGDDELIRDTETLPVMRTFTAAHDWDTGLLGPATAAQLRHHPAVPVEDQVWDQPPERLDELDLAIVATLGEDGRLPVKEVSKVVGASDSTVARRIDSMVDRGCLRFRTLIEPALLGFAAELMLWMDVQPAHLESAGRQLAEHPSTKYLSATTGRFNLCAQVSLRSFGDVYPFTTDVVGALPGVRRADTTLQLETFKRAWVPIRTPRLDDAPTERTSS